MEKYIALAVFVLAYALFVFLPKRRSWVAVGGALLLLLFGVVSPLRALALINWNVMGIFVGTLILADLFLWSRAPHFIAERLVNRSKNVCWAIVALCAFSGFISIFVENVAVVLIVAPIAFALAEKLKFSSVPLLIGIAISSNLQGTATLIGDPASMIFAAYAKFTFNDFFIYKGKLSIFFAIQIGAIASLAVLYRLFRHHGERVALVPQERVFTWAPSWLLITMIIALALSSFFDPGFGYLAGIITMAWGIVGLIGYEILGRYGRAGGRCNLRTAGSRPKDHFLEILKRLDWDTTLFLMGIFIIVGSLIEVGWIDRVAQWLAPVMGQNLLLAYIGIILIAMLFSAFIDNIPFIIAMIPVVLHVAEVTGVGRELLLFGLLIGASLGGNITPIGASANIVAVGLRQRKHIVSYREFGGIGLPFTMAAVASAAVFLWVLWR